MSESRSLLHWLRRYKPAFVHVTLRDGSKREFAKPLQGRGVWTVMEHTIRSLDGAVLLEAIAADKQTVLSTKPIDLDEPEDPEETETETAAGTHMQITDPMAAAIISVIDKVLPKIAQLFVDVGDAACARQAEAWVAGNSQQLELIKLLANRLGSLESAWHQMILEKARAAQEADTSNDQAAMGLIDRVLSGDRPNGAPPKREEPKQ